MDLLLLGLSHRTASVDDRGFAAACVGADPEAWLTRGREDARLAEVAVVATCHRLEVYAVASDLPAAEARLRNLFDDAQAERMYARIGADAALHLSRVACGLDSLIVGEAEIAGQVRRAAAVARSAGTMGPYLEAVMAGALAASGRARAETGIAQGVMSAASASVALAAAAYGSLADRSLLVVGAGQTGRLALSRAARAPHGRLIVASRSEKHAREAAADVGAEPRLLLDVPDLLREVDIVITTVHAPGIVVTRADCERAVATRGGRRLLLIDLSMPPVIEADAALVPGVDLRSVDDLGDIARQSAAQREREIPKVEAIALDESTRAYRRVVARRAARGSGVPGA